MVIKSIVKHDRWQHEDEYFCSFEHNLMFYVAASDALHQAWIQGFGCTIFPLLTPDRKEVIIDENLPADVIVGLNL